LAIAMECRLPPATRFPSDPDFAETEHRFDVAVAFTSHEASIPALKRATALASGLSARIILVVPQVVPYPLPLEMPPIPLVFSMRQFDKIVAESPVEITVRLYLCRDRWLTLASVLKPHSLVVIGLPRRWWPTREQRVARDLRHDGHKVILADAE
jgi:hypothetical protein